MPYLFSSANPILLQQSRHLYQRQTSPLTSPFLSATFQLPHLTLKHPTLAAQAPSSDDQSVTPFCEVPVP